MARERGQGAGDKHLLDIAEAYVDAFRRAVVRTGEDFRAVLRMRGSGFSIGASGTVEFTEELLGAQRNLTARALKIFGHGYIHERTVEEIARKVTFPLVGTKPSRDVAKAIVAELEEIATKQHTVVRPNYLFKLEGVDDVRLGNVRIVRRETLALELAEAHPYLKSEYTSSEEAPFLFEQLCGDAPRLPAICWAVTLRGMPKALDPQALWMIDVATSFIRLQYRSFPGMFPRLGDIEPHPIQPPILSPEGFVLSPDDTLGGTVTMPPWYQIDQEFAAALSSPETVEKLERLLDPESDTLAERLQQALGWLTRARRSTEPAERHLLFSTAIESMLTPKSNTGAITETIARLGATVWTAAPEKRAALAKEIKSLYNTRSRIAHRGERAVATPETNTAHMIAWTLAYMILKRGDLRQKHDAFLSELTEASFGTIWRPENVEEKVTE